MKRHLCLFGKSYGCLHHFPASNSTGKYSVEEFPAQTGEGLFCYCHSQKKKDPDAGKELAFAMVEKLGDHAWEGMNGITLQ